MKFHIALLGALLLAPFAQAMEWRKILKDDLSKPALAAIQVETIRNDGEMIIVRVTNKTDEKIKYRGYSKDSAQLFYEELKDGKWIDTDWMWCGTGMDIHTLSPGKKAELKIQRWRSAGDFRAYTLFDSLDDKRCALVLLYEETKPATQTP
jgi:hypothetical protein